ncbi:DNA-binding transcriptional LysR family regulator [Rhodopseudomonas julia]|uniref:DNA-binding transcriptional LysR family regulator n=1 Tax=Rhodopseudomonas julia TaxID=200617 RepID=A0ABU0C260_9BRAD|nr:LysR family transcriptional regulator [Rhodopseudomonas julia]MDQ0324603.1 DNA-binding transcriptional LysR family regulator [Rhodopseudomonas julia]
MDYTDGIRTFVAVVETGSFTAAGERLGISNKLVSKYVAALEERLGRALLYRTTRSVSLTEDGERWLPYARKVLDSLEAADVALNRAENGLAGRLRITSGTTFGELCLADAAQTFIDTYPGMRVDLVLSDEMTDLVAGGFDLAVRISVPRDSSYKMLRIGAITSQIAASPAYLEAHGTPRRPEDLADHQAILDLNDDPPRRWRFRDGKKEKVVEVAGRLAVNSASATIRQAIAGHGLVRAPDIFLSPHLARGDLVTVLDAFSADEMAGGTGGGTGGARAIHLLTVPSAFRSDKVAAFAAVLRQHLARLRGRA